MTTYTKREARILIDGTDRTAACILAKSRIEDVITSQVNSAAFTLYRHIDDTDFGLTYLQEVLVVNPLDTSERYFGGVIRQITDYQEGDYFFYDLDVVDYSWWLEHPRALVTATYASQTDAAIIANFMATTNPDIDVATYVSNVGTITNIEFEDATARATLEELAKRVGADWYVDYDKYLHWFEASASSAPAAPFTLSDGTGAGHGSRIPYQNLKRMTPAPEATKVEVIGAGSITATVTGTAVDGVHLVTKLVERDINDATQASNYGQALLDELGSAPSYSCTIFEPGIRSGQWLRLISNRRGIDDSYIVTRVTTSFLSPDGQLKMDLELGQFVPTLPEIIADVQEAVGGGSKGGAKSGGASHGGSAGRGHGHSGGADSPQVGSGGIDPSAPIEGDKLSITLDGVSWPAGNPSNIDLTSTGTTVAITPDDVGKTINLEVSASALPYAAPTISLGTAAAAGVADSVIRSDATIVAFDATEPADVGSAGVVGVASVTARRDHVHQGVHSLAKSGDTALYGDVTLSGAGGTTLVEVGQDIEISSHSGHSVSGNTGAPSSTTTPASGAHTHALSGNTGSASSTVNVGSSGHTHSIGYGTSSVADVAHRHGGNDTVVGDHGSHGHSYSGGSWGWSTSVEDSSRSAVTSVSSPSGSPSATTSVAKGTHTHVQSGNTGSPSATVTVASISHTHSGGTLTVTGT